MPSNSGTNSTVFKGECLKALMNCLTFLIERKHASNKRTDNWNNEKNYKKSLKKEIQHGVWQKMLVVPSEQCLKLGASINKMWRLKKENIWVDHGSQKYQDKKLKSIFLKNRKSQIKYK